jgi:hypothetical protein
MTINLDVASRNAMLDAIETVFGTGPIMRIRSGAKPAALSDASTGTVLATLNLPSDWLLPAAGGVKEKSGTWEDASADAAGTAGHFELYSSNGTTLRMRGTVTLPGAGGDIEVDNTSFQPTQVFTVTAFSLEIPA